MKWVGMLRTWLVGPDLDCVAEEIATQQRNDVWQRIHHRVSGMALAEARGYVRVKATELVQTAVERRIEADNSIRRDSANYLKQLTMEAVLQQAVMDLVHTRQTTRIAEPPPLRRAA